MGSQPQGRKVLLTDASSVQQMMQVPVSKAEPDKYVNIAQLQFWRAKTKMVQLKHQCRHYIWFQLSTIVYRTISGVDMPGADWAFTKLLGLRPSVKRLMMYQQGCFADGTVLRIAKDLA
ncbi:hypothetical protein L7F22_016106 [Adiantum nelumboides]|nr:hypothetical protein [Adiantum nelumboides]